jgi:hypothetical protein
MNSYVPKRYNPGFYIILSLFTFIYAAGLVFTLLSWFGIQSFDPSIWQQDALPFYAPVFMIGIVSVYGVWKWKKWGVYGLAGTWLLSGITNLVFIPPAPTPYINTFLAVLFVIAFFLFLLPSWQNME